MFGTICFKRNVSTVIVNTRFYLRGMPDRISLSFVVVAGGLTVVDGVVVVTDLTVTFDVVVVIEVVVVRVN